MLYRLAFAAVLFVCPISAAFGGPADYVFLPGVSYGEREIDFKGGS